MKSFFLHRLTLRLIYIVGAFTGAHFAALIASPKIQAFLSSSGLVLQVTDPVALKTRLTALLLFAGEFAYHFGHEKLVATMATKTTPEVL